MSAKVKNISEKEKKDAEVKVSKFFSKNDDYKLETGRFKSWLMDRPAIIASLIYNIGLILITTVILGFILFIFVGIDTVLPAMLLGAMGFSITSQTAINTMAILSITIFVSGVLIMLYTFIAKIIYKHVFMKHRMITERDESTGKLRVIKNNNANKN